MKFPTHKTKIVCTIGPASDAQRVLERMIRQGMNVARLNFAHGNFESHASSIERIRAAAKKVGKRVAILADLPGPKMRIGKLASEPVRLVRGERIVLTSEEILGDSKRISVSFPGLSAAARPGAVVFLNDGFIRLKVEETTENEVRCRIIVGGELRSHKGVNLPGTDLGISAVTDEDRRFLEFALEQGVDAVSISFVQGPEDIETVRTIAAAHAKAPFVIAKIERSVAIRRIRAIMEATDGIMVARGDLGVETPIAGIAMLQKRLIRQANLLGKPVITATQMLESMVSNSRPTRAEATDVANAILDGTDAVMLSEESAVGAYPVDAVGMLARIARATEGNHLDYGFNEHLSPSALAGGELIEETIASGVVATARKLRPRLIAIPTRTGATARRVTRYRLRPWIVGLSHNRATCQELSFSYGVHPVYIDGDRHDWHNILVDWCNREGITPGVVVMTQGSSKHNPERTNQIEVLSLGENGEE
ncbi:MAG TPA: pyruvate kinase, partial [Candidatus Acetothermia bacterium]|nr:pyruvate kinase [Candidatus Acetothermia bacterium]